MDSDIRRLAHAYSLPPAGSAVVVVDEGCAEAAAGALLRDLRAAGYTVRNGEAADEAAILVMPHRDASPRDMAGARAPVVLEYATPAGALAGVNAARAIDAEARERKARAMAAYPSQMARLPYNVAAEASAAASAAALLLAGVHLPKGQQGAELFHVSRFRAGKEEAADGISLDDGSSLAGADLLFLAPHYDDVELSSGGAVVQDIRAGARVRILYLVTGYRAEMDEAGAAGIPQRTERREAESRAAAALLGVERPIRCLRLGFYDRIIDAEGLPPATVDGQPAYRIGGLAPRREADPEYGFGGRYRALQGDGESVYHIGGRRWLTEGDIAAVRAAASAPGSGPVTICVPDETDKHPDHIAARFIGLRLAAEMSEADPDREVYVRSYRAPWAGRFNAWWPVRDPAPDPADALLAQWRQGVLTAHGLTAPELTARAGFGATPDLGFRAAEPFRCSVRTAEGYRAIGAPSMLLWP